MEEHIHLFEEHPPFVSSLFSSDLVAARPQTPLTTQRITSWVRPLSNSGNRNEAVHLLRVCVWRPFQNVMRLPLGTV